MSPLRLAPVTPAACTSCGQLEELHPCGALDQWICFDCAMKDLETTRAKLPPAELNLTLWALNGPIKFNPNYRAKLF